MPTAIIRDPEEDTTYIEIDLTVSDDTDDDNTPYVVKTPPMSSTPPPFPATPRKVTLPPMPPLSPIPSRSAYTTTSDSRPTTSALHQHVDSVVRVLDRQFAHPGEYVETLSVEVRNRVPALPQLDPLPANRAPTEDQHADKGPQGEEGEDNSRDHS